MRGDAWVGALLWWSWQSPVAHSHVLLKYLNSPRRGMFKLNAKFDADSLLYLLSLNVMVTQYTCSLNGVYRPNSEVVIVHAYTFQSTLLGTRLLWCRANCSHYINNGCTFSRQTSYLYIVKFSHWCLRNIELNAIFQGWRWFSFFLLSLSVSLLIFSVSAPYINSTDAWVLMVGLRDLRNFFLLIQTFYSPLSLFCRSLRLLHGASPHIQCLR